MSGGAICGVCLGSLFTARVHFAADCSMILPIYANAAGQGKYTKFQGFSIATFKNFEKYNR